MNTHIRVLGPSADRTPHAAKPWFRELFCRRPLLCFFVLSSLFAWWPAPLYAAGWSPVPQVGFGPFFAALAVLGVTQGRAGVRSLLGSMVMWSVPIRAYVVALGLPVVITVGAIGANLLLGAEAPSAHVVGLWTQIPVSFVVVLLVPGWAGAWEEPGFRGFALEPHETPVGLPTAPPVLGVCWVGWHLPLFVAGDILWPDVLVIMGASVVLAAVYHVGRESVLVVMLMHATNNAVGGGYASRLFVGPDATRLNLLVALGWVVVAAAVIARGRNGTPRRGPGTRLHSGA